MPLSLDHLFRLNRLLLTILMIFAWTGAAHRTAIAADPPAARAVDDGPTPKQLTDTADFLDRMGAVLEQSVKSLPADTFDIASVATLVGNDSIKAFEWVRDHTTWVPYGGCLRGSFGVLQDRLGNSLDRAILLGELLQAAGHEARLVHATLAPDDAVKLLAKVRPLPHAQAGNPGDFRKQTLGEIDRLLGAGDPTDRQFVRETFERGQVSAEHKMEDVVQRSIEQAAAVTAAMGAPLPDTTAVDRVAAAVAIADHWWVQSRDGDKWTDLDPLLPDAKPGIAPAPVAETVVFDPATKQFKLPAAQLQEVELRVVGEQWKDEHLAEVVPFKRVLRPTELKGRHVSFGHVPLDWPIDPQKAADPGTLAALVKAAAEPREWVPALVVGGETETQASITDAGELDLHPKMDALGRVGKSIAKPLTKVTDIFDNVGADPAQPAPAASPRVLTAEWLEFVIRVPGKPERIVRREVFDLLGSAARATVANTGAKVPLPKLDATAKAGRGLAMLGETHVLVTGATPSPEFIQFQSSQTWITNRKPLSKLFRECAANADKVTPVMTDAAGELQEFPAPLFYFAACRHAWSPRRDDVFLASPNVFCLHASPGLNAAGEVRLCRALDIAVNDVGVRDGAPGGSGACRMMQGVVDTNVEWAVLAGCGELQNTADAFARSAPEDWVLIRSTQDAAWGGLKLSTDDKARIEAELNAGQTVLVSRAAIGTGSDSHATWWRIDPRTGLVLGIGVHGWGATAAEYIAMLRVALRGASMVVCLGLAVGGSGSTGAKVALGAACVVGSIVGAVGAAGGPLLGFSSAVSGAVSAFGDAIALGAGGFKLATR